MLDIKAANWVLGYALSGDIGPLTFYHSQRNRHVVFDKKPNLHPASAGQLRQRNRFRRAAQAWHGLDKESRRNWERVSRRLGCRCIGYHLWVWWQLRQDLPALRTIERQSGIQLVD